MRTSQRRSEDGINRKESQSDFLVEDRRRPKWGRNRLRGKKETRDRGTRVGAARSTSNTGLKALVCAHRKWRGVTACVWRGAPSMSRSMLESSSSRRPKKDVSPLNGCVVWKGAINCQANKGHS